jgi:hypothetical protein
MTTLQNRIVEVLQAHQPLQFDDLARYLPMADNIDLDTSMLQLLRADRVDLKGVWYSLKNSAQPVVPAAAKKFVSIATPGAVTPPTAEEEAAASLQVPKAWCEECKTDHVVSEFRQRSDGSPFKYCKKSHAQRMQRARKPSDPSTPIQPQQEKTGSLEPPATSSEHLPALPADGTQPPGVRAENPEALPPVPSAGGIAAIGHKRDELVARKEALQADLQRCTQQLVPEAFA